MNFLTLRGLPPYKLYIKLGAPPAMLLCNIHVNPARGHALRWRYITECIACDELRQCPITSPQSTVTDRRRYRATWQPLSDRHQLAVQQMQYNLLSRAVTRPIHGDDRISASIIPGSDVGPATDVVTAGNRLCKYAEDTYLIILSTLAQPKCRTLTRGLRPTIWRWIRPSCFRRPQVTTTVQPLLSDIVPLLILHQDLRCRTVCLFLNMSRHRRRSGWNSGGRMASAEGGSVPSGVKYGEGCPLSSRLGSLGERCDLPQLGPGHMQPRPKTDFGVFWRLQNAPFCTYITNICGGGQFALASPTPNYGDFSPVPRDMPGVVSCAQTVQTLRTRGIQQCRWYSDQSLLPSYSTPPASGISLLHGSWQTTTGRSESVAEFAHGLCLTDHNVSEWTGRRHWRVTQLLHKLNPAAPCAIKLFATWD